MKPASGWPDLSRSTMLAASDGTGWDEFGSSVAISGDTVVVGARNATCPIEGGSGPGAAYVFFEPAGWPDTSHGPDNLPWAVGETARLTASDGVNYDAFGTSVAISGDTVVVGACFATYGLDYDSAGPGAAYVFAKPTSGWADMNETAKLRAGDGVNGGMFGGSVAMSGGTLVVGAPGAAGPGAAYVFSPTEKYWTVMVYLDGQNDLESNLIANFEDMSLIGSGLCVDIVVEMGRMGAVTDYDGWAGVRRGLVHEFDHPTSDWGETVGSGFAPDMGDWDTLEDFLAWAKTNYPAQNYALILSDHGAGFRAPAWEPAGERSPRTSLLWR